MESDVRGVGDGSSRSAAQIGGGGSFGQQVVGFCTLTYVLNVSRSPSFLMFIHFYSLCFDFQISR